MEELKLKACPFCGGEADLRERIFNSESRDSSELDRRSHYIYVKCTYCFAQSRAYEYDSEEIGDEDLAETNAIRAWNERDEGKNGNR